MFEYRRPHTAKQGKSVSFDIFINQGMDGYVDLLGMKAIIKTRRALGPSILQKCLKVLAVDIVVPSLYPLFFRNKE
jgi:hypothetical protein